MNWSRQKAYLTGSSGYNETDVVKGTSELADSNAFTGTPNTAGGNYQHTHRGGMTGNMLLGQPNYQNTNTYLHNNINQNVLLEQTFDNKIFIDAEYKDFASHPEPYKFIVKFNGCDPTIEKIYVKVENEFYEYNKYIKGDTVIVINQIFKNVKYVNVNTLIMPTHIEFVTQEDGSYKISGKQIAKTHRYLVLKIDELRNSRKVSNKKSLGKECFIMKNDDNSGINNEYWIPIYDKISYFDSNLRNIDRLTVELCDDQGRRLCTKLDGKNFDFYADYRNTIDLVKVLQDRNTSQSRARIESLTPKLESLKMITSYVSPELHLTFNTLEPQIDTQPQFNI
jgi:hypothetical protein